MASIDRVSIRFSFVFCISQLIFVLFPCFLMLLFINTLMTLKVCNARFDQKQSKQPNGPLMSFVVKHRSRPTRLRITHTSIQTSKNGFAQMAVRSCESCQKDGLGFENENEYRFVFVSYLWCRFCLSVVCLFFSCLSFSTFWCLCL